MTAGDAVAAVRAIVVAVGGGDAALPPTAVGGVADAALQQQRWHSAGQPSVSSSSTASAGAVS